MTDINTLLRTNPLVRSFMDSLPCGIIVLDEEGRVQAMNNILKNVVGVSENQKARTNLQLAIDGQIREASLLLSVVQNLRHL